MLYPRITIMYSTAPPTAGHIERLSDIANGYRVDVAISEEQALQFAPDSVVILGHRYLWQTLPYSQNLKWIQSSAAGVDHLLVPELWRCKPLLTRTPIFSDVIAWHALALSLAQLRGILLCNANQGKHQLAAELPNLKGIPRVAMILGTGHIGQHLGKLLSGMGVTVIGVNRSGSTPETSHFHILVAVRDNWQRHLDQVDLLFLCAPLTQETRKIIGSDVLDRLPDTAVIVNVGRGGLIDHSALANHLEQGRLAASLDVMDTVTHEERTRLETLPNVIITPKIASFCPDRQARYESFVEAQMGRFISGQPLLHLVDYSNVN